DLNLAFAKATQTEKATTAALA
ncbi:MAG: hypothetical protein RLY16_1225, partial [Bacteroidota bacterium]